MCGPALTPQTPALLLLIGPDLNKAAVEPASDPNDYPSFSKEDMKKGLEALQTGARLAAEQVWKCVGRCGRVGGEWQVLVGA